MNDYETRELLDRIAFRLGWVLAVLLVITFNTCMTAINTERAAIAVEERNPNAGRGR